MVSILGLGIFFWRHGVPQVQPASHQREQNSLQPVWDGAHHHAVAYYLRRWRTCTAVSLKALPGIAYSCARASPRLLCPATRPFISPRVPLLRSCLRRSPHCGADDESWRLGNSGASYRLTCALIVQWVQKNRAPQRLLAS
jgi:hypothetical protein